jgi:hypothetical protein
VIDGTTLVVTKTQKCDFTSSASEAGATCFFTSSSANQLFTQSETLAASQVTFMPVTITAGAQKLIQSTSAGGAPNQASTTGGASTPASTTGPAPTQATPTGAAAKTRMGMGSMMGMLALLLVSTAFTL